MAIDVGDAIFHFLADTTDLDAAFNRIADEAAAKLQPATSGMAGIGQAARDLNADLDATGENVEYAGEKIIDSSKESAKALSEAKGEARLLGEAIGVSLPRHVSNFVAELPGVTQALEAAFTATAIFFLIEAVIKITEKMSEFISSTFIYTDAMKEMDKAGVAANNTLLAHAEAINKAKAALDSYGMTASQKTQLAIDQNNKAWVQNTAKIAQNKEEMEKLKAGQSGVADALGVGTTSVLNTIEKYLALSMGLNANTERWQDNTLAMRENTNQRLELEKSNQQLAAELAILNLQLRDEEDEARKQTAQRQLAFNQTRISAAQSVGSALLNLQKAQAEASIAFDDNEAVKRLMIEKSFGEAQYQLTLSTAKQKAAASEQSEAQIYRIEVANLQNRLSAQEKMGIAGKDGAAATQVQIEELAKTHGLKMATLAAQANAEVEVLEKQHEAKLITDAKKFADDFQQIIKTAFSARGARVLPDLGQDIQQLQQIQDAAKQLGITLESSLVKASADAKKSVDVLTQGYKDNKNTLDDLNRAKLAFVQAEIRQAQATGQSTKALQAEEKELKKLIPEVQQTVKVHKDLQDMIKSTDSDFNNFVEAMAEGSQSMAQSAKQLAEALIGTLEKYAEKKGAESMAMGFSQLAVGDPKASISFEAAGLWFLLAAAGAAAQGAIAGSGSGSGSGSSSGSGQTATIDTSQGATQVGSNPTQERNIPHLAAGGLITQPTLAVLGENSRPEAVIPLSDGNAINALAEAFARKMGTGGGGGTNFYIDGVISGDNLNKIVKKVSRNVSTGRTRLTASNTHKITRRG